MCECDCQAGGGGERGKERKKQACKSGRGRYCARNYTSLFCQTLLLLDIYFDLAEAPLLAVAAALVVVVVPLAVVVVVVVLASSIL